MSLVAGPDVGGAIALVWAIGCSGGIIVAGRRLMGRAKRTYVTLGVCGLLMTAGVAIRSAHGLLVGVEQPLPSPADLVHLPAYLIFFGTVLSVHTARARKRDLDAWLDSLAPVIALTLVIWVFHGHDIATDAAVSIGARSLNLAYSIIVLAALSVLLRATSTPGDRPAAYYMLGGACVTFLAADLIAAHTEQTLAVVALSPFPYGLSLAAVLHRSAQSVLEPHEEAPLSVGRLRISAIALTVLSPLLLLGSNFDPGSPQHLPGVALAVLLALVVVLRVGRLLTQQERSTALERRLAESTAQLNRYDDAAAIAQNIPRLLNHILERRGVRTTAVGGPRSIRLPPEIERLVGSPFVTIPSGQLNANERRACETALQHARLSVATSEAAHADARRALETQLAEQVAASERRFRALVSNASDVVLVLDRQGNLTYASDTVERMMGYCTDAVIGRPLNDFMHEHDREPAFRWFASVVEGAKEQGQHEFRVYTASREVRLFEAVMTDMTEVEEVEGIVVNATDVTERRSLERDLRDAESIDPLTLQLNRSSFIAETTTALRRASISNVAVSIAIIDLQGFKAINEALGPHQADQVLVEAANRIRQTVRLSDQVSRLSGDEFGVLLSEGYTSIDAIAAIERVLEALRQPFQLGRENISLDATAGLALDVAGKVTASLLMRDADNALGHAKRHSPGNAVLFEEEMHSEARERFSLRSALDDALRKGDLRLAYQPIIDAQTQKIASLEALARWNHDEHGEISPGTFIPIAEESGMISALGDWALTTACAQINEWSRRGLSEFTVSVNMSGITLIEPDVVPRVRRIIDSAGVDPGRIIIEITESVLIDDSAFIAERLQDLRSIGVGLAIDDFGTGYSSLSYLQRYEFDYLKIDRSFVRPLADESKGKEREIVRAIVSLAKGLGAKTIAEGIEGETEAAILQEMACDRLQGFLFHRPTEAGPLFEILCEDLALDVVRPELEMAA